jgi:hypothetical protein
MAVQYDLSQYFESYLNYSEKSDANLVFKINNEANRVLGNYYNNYTNIIDDEGLRLYLITYIDELRHTMFDNHNRPSWAVRPGQPLMPYYPPMNIPPPPPPPPLAYNIAPPVYNNPPYVVPPRRQTRRRQQASSFGADEVPPLDTGEGYLYKSRKRRPRRGKRARARRSKKYTN